MPQESFGGGHDRLLHKLRQQGLDEIHSMVALISATGLSVTEAKRLLLASPVWADRREAHESFERALRREAFIMCVADGGTVDEPPKWAAECRERQQLSLEQMADISAGLPGSELSRYREAAGAGRPGGAFAALTVAGKSVGAGQNYWRAMTSVAQTLCLDELLDRDTPPADDDDWEYAVHEVYRLSGGAA
jgi:hypothetical protein